MGELQGIARFTFHEGKVDEFNGEHLAHRMEAIIAMGDSDSSSLK